MPLLLGVRQELPTVPFVVVTRIPDTFAWLDWWAWTHSPGGVFDRLRSGPTSDVWISPWAQYLRKSGVGLHTGSVLTQFTIPGQRVTGAIVNGTPVTADFYIAAMPVEVMASLVTDDLKRAAPSIANLTRLQTRWMNGIQFYLAQDGEFPAKLHEITPG